MASRFDDNNKQNPGQINSDQLFDLSKSEKKGNFNGSDRDDDIKSAEEDGDSNIINNVKGKESNSSSNNPVSNFLFNKLKLNKDRWPFLVAILMTLGGGIGMLTVLTPGLAIMQVEKAFTKYLDDSSPALHVRTRKMFANKFNKYSARSDYGSEFDLKANKSSCGIQCKFLSVNEKTVKKLKAQGFDVDLEIGTGAASGRYMFKSITFPAINKDTPRVTATSGDSFITATGKTAQAASFNKVFNTTSSFFTNKKFSSLLNKKFNLDKTSNITADSDDPADKDSKKKKRNKIKKAIKEKIGLPEKNFKELIDFRSNKSVTKFRSVESGADLADMVCAGYNVTKATSTAVKVAKIAAFSSYAMMILSYSGKLTAGEETDPDITNEIGNIITETDSNGKNITSSKGYRLAAYGDPIKLSEDEKKYSLAITNGAFTTITAVLSAIQFVGGKDGYTFLHRVCKSLSVPGVSIVVSCPAEMLGMVIGLLTGGILSIEEGIKCATKNLVISALVGVVVNALIQAAIGAFVKSELPELDDKTRGDNAGNAIYNGTAQILGGKSASYGLKAGSKEEIKRYAIDVSEIKQQQEDIARYEAGNNQFDINNQYSFLSNIIQKTRIVDLINSPLPDKISTLTSFTDIALKSVNSNVYAEADKKAENYDQCKDGNLAFIGADADAFCNPAYVMNGEELNMATNDSITYMLNNGIISDTTGDIIGKDQKAKDYKMYIENCVNRTDPLGETSTDIAEGDFLDDDYYLWKLGYNCTNPTNEDIKEEIKYFRAYTMDKSISDSIDESEDEASGSAAGTEIDVANLYKASDNIACAPGTTEAIASQEIRLDSGEKIKIKLCYIPNTTDSDSENRTFDSMITVNSRVSGAWLALINDMRTATGENTISASSSFRTYDMQMTNGNYWSKHETGIAVDFGSLYSCAGCAIPSKGEKSYFDFLEYSGGGKKYGFQYLRSPLEAWHWEPIE